MNVAIFCEDDFDSISVIECEADFSVFSDGFDAAAASYGGGKWRLYLLPRDESNMLKDEHVGEVMRANEEIDRIAKR